MGLAALIVAASLAASPPAEYVLSHQQTDGGWAITWEPPGAAAALEYRGVETVRALRVLGCPYAQGYHFGRPLAQPNAVAAPPKHRDP